MKKRINSQHEKGQSLVELALMLVFILILLAGVVDLGRMMYEYLTMRDAAQEGAGYGAVYPSYCDQIVARVMDNLPDANYTPDVTVNTLDCEVAYEADIDTPFPTNGCNGKEIIVSVDHIFTITVPLLTTFTGPTVPMHVEIKDRIVRPSCN